MMSSTHAAAGLALAAAFALLAPALGIPAGVVAAAAVGALAGGIFPDLDLAATHRKTLHFPVYYSVAAAGAVAVAALAPGPWTVGGAFFLLSAAVHSVSDVLGGSVEARPWLATDDRAVFLHVRGQWLPARRWIRYDGAPEDLGAAAVLALPGLAVFDGPIQTATLALLAVSAGYVLIRKRLPEFEEKYLQ
ncbi:MAG: metal-dependent hydrolase [Haloferacaceae archaeon]